MKKSAEKRDRDIRPLYDRVVGIGSTLVRANFEYARTRTISGNYPWITRFRVEKAPGDVRKQDSVIWLENDKAARTFRWDAGSLPYTSDSLTVPNTFADEHFAALANYTKEYFPAKPSNDKRISGPNLQELPGGRLITIANLPLEHAAVSVVGLLALDRMISEAPIE